MSARQATWLAWSLAGLCVAMFVATFPLWVLARSAHVPSGWSVNLSIGGLLGVVLFVVFPLVGAMIASRRPRNPIGWILLADGLLWMLTGLTDYYRVYGLASPGSVPFPVTVAGISNFMWVPAVGLSGTYMFLLFPDGRLPSRRWRPLAWLSGVVIVVLCIGVGLAPGPLPSLGRTRNPFGLEDYPWVETAGYIVLPLLLLCMLASVLSLVMRFRRSRGEERQQIKWIAFAASLYGLLFLVNVSLGFFFPPEAYFQAGSPLWLDLSAYAILISFTLVPVAIGFAVLRYRLYEIDMIINRTLVYGSLTISLALVYVSLVVSLQYVFRALTGGDSQLVIVASTLAIAALFNPLRGRIQSFIDRRFYRRKYDATKTLETFGATLRDETDLKQLHAGLLAVVGETLQPAHVSLWLKPARTVRNTEEQDR